MCMACVFWVFFKSVRQVLIIAFISIIYDIFLVLRAPVAVGSTLMSGSDMFDSGMKGKGIHASHLLGDELW